MNTPYYVLSLEKLNKNVDSFKSALGKIWPNSKIAYSIKTNSLPWLLDYLRKNHIMAEAVSDEEYQLAVLCGYKDKEIVFNGPIKGERIIRKAINGEAIINIDSKNDLQHVCNAKLKSLKHIGIRVNLDTNLFDAEDIGYINDGFRFGFSDKSGELDLVINKLYEISNIKNFGLHLHCNSITRSLNVYKTIAKYAADLITRYNLSPAFIDIGGGFFGGVEGKPTAEQYISVIYNELSGTVDPKVTKLIIEPGSALIASAIDLHTSVVDIKDTANARIVTTDGSRIHIDPLWKKNKYLYDINKKNITSTMNIHDKQIICGYTCMDHDRIMSINNDIVLNIGDEIVYRKVGAYTTTFGGPFIRYFPDVYIDAEGNKTLIRRMISVEDYFKMQSL